MLLCLVPAKNSAGGGTGDNPRAGAPRLGPNYYFQRFGGVAKGIDSLPTGKISLKFKTPIRESALDR